jgi:hypothetical protein
LIPEDQVRLCVLHDGTRCIWNHVNTLLHAAVRILDDDHGREHVYKVGTLQVSADAVQEQESLETMAALPCCGYGDWAIEGLQALPPRDTQAAEEIRQLIGLLHNNAAQLHNRKACKGGYPMPCRSAMTRRSRMLDWP